MFIFLAIFFLNGVYLSNIVRDKLLEASELKERLELKLFASRHLLSPEIIATMIQVLECDEPNRSSVRDKDLFLGDESLLKDKFIHICELRHQLKTSRQFRRILNLFWSAFDFTNRLIFDLRADYINYRNPDCNLDDLTLLLIEYPFHVSAYNFSYYSLIYIAYFQFTHKEKIVFATFHNFTFSKLHKQVLFILYQLYSNIQSKKTRNKARRILIFLKQLIEVKFNYNAKDCIATFH